MSQPIRQSVHLASQQTTQLIRQRADHQPNKKNPANNQPASHPGRRATVNPSQQIRNCSVQPLHLSRPAAAQVPLASESFVTIAQGTDSSSGEEEESVHSQVLERMQHGRALLSWIGPLPS